MIDFRCSPSSPVVETERGPVRGYITHDICVFKGIPYAKAQRFHAPEKPDKWTDVMDATSFGYVCPLMELAKPQGEMLVPHRYWVMGEDCMNLNLWTPACDDKKRPVLVWLHGGGYSFGSAIEHISYEGENMARFGDCVVISINHRLNVLGYLDLSAFGDEYATSANNGGEDIIMSLRWVKENIAKFGGDPDNVTVFGQSGGGGKVTTLLQSPAADGLFHKGIVMSGVFEGLLSANDTSAEACVRAMMKELKVETVKAMETIPYAELAAAYMKVSADLRKKGENVGCMPFKNQDYAGDPLLYGFRKESIKVPLMVGSVIGEFNCFLTANVDRDALTREECDAIVRKLYGEEAEVLLEGFAAAYPDRKSIDLLFMDSIARPATTAYVQRRAKEGGKVYSYMFDQDFEVGTNRPAWHCADIPYFFHNKDLAPYAEGPAHAEQLQNEIFGAVMAFARTGDPNHADLPQWDASTADEENTMLFGEKTHQAVNHDHALMSHKMALRKVRLADVYGGKGQMQH